MPASRPPLLPRIGFAVLTIALVVLLLVFGVLFFVVPDERWSFALPAGGMLFGLSWVRTTRRAWLAKHTATPDAAVASPAPDAA